MTAEVVQPSYDAPFRAERSPMLWLLEREVQRFLNIWSYSLVGPVLSGLLFVIVFGSALGNRIPAIDGVAYGTYIIPGLVAQAIVNVGFFNGSTSLFEARNDRYIHDVFASPLRWWEINLAYLGAAVLREVIVGLGVLLPAALLIGGISIADPLVLTVGTLGLLVVAAQTGVVVGALATSFDHNYAIESVVLLPLGLLGGIFYSVRDLPHPWDVVSRFDPFFWLIEVQRIGFLGHGEVGGGLALLVVWLLAGVLAMWTAHIFASGRLKP